MITVAIEEYAGLGNQLFQYAHSYALAKRYNQKLQIVSYIGKSDNLRKYMLDQLKLDEGIIDKIVRVDRANIFGGKVFKGSNALNRIYRYRLQHKYSEMCRKGKMEARCMSKDQCRIFVPDAALEKGKDYYVEGFYESYKYFCDAAKDVRVQLKLKSIPTDRESVRWMDEIKKCNSVAVHIRMGDFVTCNRLFPIEFYDGAIAYIESQISNPMFYIFSEDKGVKAYFQEKKKSNVRIVTVSAEKKDMIEWYLMSLCHHHVVTNSTYSWWSAFASDYPEKRVFIPDRDLYLEKENASIYLSQGKKHTQEHYDNYFLPEYEVIHL